MRSIKLFIVLALGVSMIFSSCSKENSPKQTTQNEVKKEGKLEGTTWTIKNADLPSEQMRIDYESLSLTVREDMTYDWLWKKNDGGS